MPEQTHPYLSEEITDIVNHTPPWLIQKCNLIFLIVFSFIIAVSCFIRYPDEIKTSMRIVAVNAPKILVSKVDGKIEKIFVKNDEQVQKGQKIAILQSNTNFEQVLCIEAWLNHFDTLSKAEDLAKAELPALDNIGELQQPYEDFKMAMTELKQTLSGNGFYHKILAALTGDLLTLQQVQTATAGQKLIAEQDYELQKVEYNANELLAKDNIISRNELNQSKSKLLNKQQNVIQCQAQILSNNIQQANKEKEILDLHKSTSEQLQKAISLLYILKSRVQDWMLHYAIIAPLSGKISYEGFLQENQYIAVNTELFYVIPDSSHFYGEVKGNSQGLGKVKVGEKVIIKVNSFPSEEYGFLKGTISYIPAILREDSALLIRVDFDNGLTTNYHRNLAFKSNMIATAEIIVKDRNLFDRIFGQFRELSR